LRLDSDTKQERVMKIPGSAKRTANGREAVTDDNPCAVEAGGWTPPASVQSFANAACDFMVSRPIATLWSKTPYRFELLLFAMAAAVRFYDLHYPDSVVFDEYHFGAFVNKYNWGKYFFDIHPPLGKLTLLWVGQLTGYDATTCSYDSIHDVYADNCKYMILRNVAGAFARLVFVAALSLVSQTSPPCLWCSAFFGCLLPPCLFSIARKMGMSNSVAFLVGSLSVFDSMEVIESRHILVDSQLMFYCGLSLWFALKYWDALERVSSFAM
jgi:dolichyl-phosphate-mannose--protein O-mannosyl transferase